MSRGVVRMCDLPPHSLGELLDRVRCAGLEPVELPRPMNHPPGSFHGDCVGFNLGILYWHLSSPIDTFAHEAAHAMLLDDPVGWEAPEFADMKTSEDVVMVLQCELLRGLEGAGVRRSLRAMDHIGYTMFGRGRAGDDFPREVKAATWWRSLSDRPEHPRPSSIPWREAVEAARHEVER